jgi:hypothetical protein
LSPLWGRGRYIVSMALACSSQACARSHRASTGSISSMLNTEPEALRCRLSPCQQHQEHSISQHRLRRGKPLVIAGRCAAGHGVRFVSPCGRAHDEHRPGLTGRTCRAQPVRCLARPAARWRAGARTGAADRGRCTERAALPVGEDTGLRRMDPVDFVGEGGSGRFDMDSGVRGLCACVSRACPPG